MKVNLNKNHYIPKKLVTKSFINTKKDKVLLGYSQNKLDVNKNRKTMSRHSMLKNSKSTDKNNKKYDLHEKCNTSRDSLCNNNIINRDKLRTSDNSKKKNFNTNRINISSVNKKNEKERDNKISYAFCNSEMKNYPNSKNFRHNLSVKNRNLNFVGHNKTLNFIKVKNSKLNKALKKYNENNMKDKNFNCFLPIRNYNSLRKNSQMNRSLNSGINKRYNNNYNIDNKKKCNNSLKMKQNTINKSFDNSNLKIKLNKNRSLENSRLKFYKVDKKFYNGNLMDRTKKLKKTIIQNYKFNFDLFDDMQYSTGKGNLDISHDIKIISSSFNYDIELEKEPKKEMKDNKENKENKKNNEKKENKENKVEKQLNFDIAELKIDNGSKNEINIAQTERGNKKTMKNKMNTSILPISSKSVKKRKIIKIDKKHKKNALRTIVKEKENINIKKVNNNEEINNTNHSINDDEIINKDNEKKDNINFIKNNFNTLPNNNKLEAHNEIFDIDTDKKHHEIFEIISDVKVKSFTEYEQDKKNIGSNEKTAVDKIIESPKKGNQNLPNITTDNEENLSFEKEKFIEDRDEYNIMLKETFSKDRFSFRPTNNNSHETFPDLKSQNEVLDKKDFINHDIMPNCLRFDTIRCSVQIKKKGKKNIYNNNIYCNTIGKIKNSKSKDLKNYNNY